MLKLKKILKLRDDIARVEDESRIYVLPNEIIFKLIDK